MAKTKNKYTNDYITIYGIDEKIIKNFGFKYKKIRDAYILFIPDTKTATELIMNYPSIFIDYEITKGKMDDVFLSVTGKALEGGNE